MISVIIPFMADTEGHYQECLDKCLVGLSKQTAELEIIVSRHDTERYIRKNYLLNEGFKKSNGNVIFHCDADFTFDDPDALQIALNRLDEVIYPIFYSPKFKKMKIADGGFFGRRSALKRHGPLDKKALGISYVTFPLLEWCIKNTAFDVHEDFIVNHVEHRRFKKIHAPTRARLVSKYKNVIRKNEYKMFDMR